MFRDSIPTRRLVLALLPVLWQLASFATASECDQPALDQAPLERPAQAAQLDQETLDAWRVSAGVPGIAVLAFDRSGVRWSLHAGERAQDSGVPVEADDLWHLGSNAKAMTATLVEVLARKGLIDRKASVAQLLASSISSIDPHWNQVGFDALLSHCSGLPANLSALRMLSLIGTDQDRDARADRLSAVEGLLAEAPEQSTDPTFRYSNAGYMTAGAMLEAATGAGYFELLDEHVLQPLGINSAGVGAPGSADTLDQPRGHREGWFGGLKAIPPGAAADNPPALTPAGRIHMRLDDYARFLTDLARGLDGCGALLPKTSYQRLIRTGCSDRYALGWGRDAAGRLTHAGSNTMWLVRAWLDPDTGQGLIIASNDGRIDKQSEVIEQIRQRVLPD